MVISFWESNFWVSYRLSFCQTSIKLNIFKFFMKSGITGLVIHSWYQHSLTFYKCLISRSDNLFFSDLFQMFLKFFLLNFTSCVCSVKSGWKTIFYWKVWLLIAVKSLLKVVALVWISFTTGKRTSHQQKDYNLKTIDFINRLCK